MANLTHFWGKTAIPDYTRGKGLESTDKVDSGLLTPMITIITGKSQKPLIGKEQNYLHRKRTIFGKIENVLVYYMVKQNVIILI